MATPPRSVGKLTSAADHFEQELARYERLSNELARTSVHSEKSLGRKRRLLQELSECEEELGGRLKGLLVAMNDARDRQQRGLEIAVKAASELRERAEQFSELMDKVTALGERARSASQPAGPLLTAADGQARAEDLTPLEQTSEQLQTVLSEAENIARAATEQNWPEVARDVNSLRQQLSSLNAKVTRLRTDIAQRTLS